MTFLAMDTGRENVVLALADELQGGRVTAALVFEGHRSLSRKLMGQIDLLLHANDLRFNQLTAFAVGIGPGSFTGIRIGLTTARTFAQVTGKPLIGICTLDACAEVWRGAANDIVTTILRSRKDEVYAAVYRGAEDMDAATPARFLAPLAETHTLLRERLQRLESSGRVTLAGDPALCALIATNYPCLKQLWTPPDGLAALAAQRLAAGFVDDPLALAPLYVVPPTITTPKDPEARGRSPEAPL